MLFKRLFEQKLFSLNNKDFFLRFGVIKLCWMDCISCDAGISDLLVCESPLAVKHRDMGDVLSVLRDGWRSLTKELMSASETRKTYENPFERGWNNTVIPFRSVFISFYLILYILCDASART